jgi:hypothetical protein
MVETRDGDCCRSCSDDVCCNLFLWVFVAFDILWVDGERSVGESLVQNHP